MDKLNELSSSLLDLIPWHTREGLDKLVTEDNERYRAASDTITQQVDKINADILKSQQVDHQTNELTAFSHLPFLSLFFFFHLIVPLLL